MTNREGEFFIYVNRFIKEWYQIGIVLFLSNIHRLMKSFVDQSLLKRIAITCSFLLSGMLIGTLAGLTIQQVIREQKNRNPVFQRDCDSAVGWEFDNMPVVKGPVCAHQQRMIEYINTLRTRKQYLESFPGDVMKPEILATQQTIESLEAIIIHHLCW